MISIVRGYFHAKKNNAPMDVYNKWVKAKLKLDFLVGINWLVFSPFFITQGIIFIIDRLCESITDIWIIDKRPLNKDVFKYRDEYHQWLRDNDLIHTLRDGRKRKK